MWRRTERRGQGGGAPTRSLRRPAPTLRHRGRCGERRSGCQGRPGCLVPLAAEHAAAAAAEAPYRSQAAAAVACTHRGALGISTPRVPHTQPLEAAGSYLDPTKAFCIHILSHKLHDSLPTRKRGKNNTIPDKLAQE